MTIGVIIAAAGRGSRLGADGPKALLPLAGQSLLTRCLRPFLSHPAVRAIAVAVPDPGAAGPDLTDPRLRLVRGGAERQDSVRTALEAIPEADFGRVKVRRSNYAERIKTGGFTVQVGRGRPRGGAETGPTVLKSVRLPPAIWKELEKRARAEGVAVHALVRKAILALLRSAA